MLRSREEENPPTTTRDDFISAQPGLGEKREWRIVPLDVKALDDDTIVRALEDAIRDTAQRIAEYGHEPDPDRGEPAFAVADILAGYNDSHDDVSVSTSDLIRVGQRLGKLAREGRIRLVSKDPREYALPRTRSGRSPQDHPEQTD